MHSTALTVSAAPVVEHLNSFTAAKIRRERMRWFCLCQLDQARPEAMTDEALLALVQAVYPDTSRTELRREADYLKMRELLMITVKGGVWHMKLTWQGIDIVEYTTSCPAGIGRPQQPEA